MPDSLSSTPRFALRPATAADIPLILDLIKKLAEYEQLIQSVTATEAILRDSLFGPKPAAEVIIAESGSEPAGFAVFFHTYSTFHGRPGLYLEDLFVLPQWRRRGLGRLLLAEMARIAVERGCPRFEWSVLNWNEMALSVYRSVGAKPMDQWTVQRLEGEALHALAAEAQGRAGD